MAELTVPRLDFSPLANLPKVYEENAKKRTLAEIGRGLADGSLDYNSAGAKLAGLGDLNSGLSLIKLGQEQKAGQEFMQSIPGLYGGGQSQSVSNPMGNSANAIASIESGGRYDAQGPVTKTGDRALGKYQVMGANVGPWTKEVLGREMTPQEFLASPEAQDKVFQAKFGQYTQKYGPNGAARAWFAGEGGMNDPNRRDQLGTSVADYGNRFDRAMGFAPTQVASNDPSVGVPQPQPPTQSQPLQIVAGQQPSQPQAQPQSDGLTISPRIQSLLQAVANPRLPAAQKDVAKILLQRELDASKLPEPVKQYMFARSQGYGGSFMEYQTELKKAGATNVTVDQKGETKFEEEFGKKQADRWNSYLTNADAARKKLVDIDTMREISGRMGSQGAAASIKESIGPYAEALGINVDGLSDIQAYNQIIQRLAPQQRAVGSGSTSDIEFKGFLKSLPGLSQNPLAREMGLNTMEALARDDVARGEIASKLATGEIKRADAEKMLRALPDPMKGFVEWRKANPQLYSQALKGASSASSPASSKAPPIQGARQAPDGQFYIQRDGKWFRVEQ